MGIWPRFYKRAPVFIHRQCQFGIISLADGDFPVPDYTAAAIGNHHGVGARRDILQIKTAVFIRPTGFAADVHRHAGKRIAVRIGHRSADAVAFVVRRGRGVFINRPEYGVQSCGYYFLPEAAVRIWGWQGFSWLAPLALTVYLVMNSRRDFWRLLGLAAAWSAGALLAAYLVSLSGGWYLSKYINFAVSDLFGYGIYDGLLYWFTLWLAVVCALISAYWLMHSLVRQRTQARTLELKNRLLLDSYHTIEQKMRDSAALRHEFRHQITALDALYQQKDFDRLGKLLSALKHQESQLSQTRFTDNITVNAILQDAASRAAQAGAAFNTQVHIPTELTIPEKDLCMLLMNMLDNALEACKQVEKPEERFIRFKADVKNGFLAIKCENRYAGILNEGEHDELHTTKPDNMAHGFGLPQMSAVAEKYHSLLNISYTEEHVFIVQTALKLPKKKQA